jgi:hypothetical protein
MSTTARGTSRPPPKTRKASRYTVTKNSAPAARLGSLRDNSDVPKRPVERRSRIVARKWWLAS